jgi:hypothetical protein
MKVAIMQPYFFPYIGYFQLMAAVDVFVIYDDVQYVERSWMNRNIIRMGNTSKWLTMPVSKAARSTAIMGREYLPSATGVDASLGGLLTTCYRHAPYFDSTSVLVRDLIRFGNRNVAALNANLLFELSKRLGISCSFLFSSQIEQQPGLSGSRKIIEICLRTGATEYINPIGGINLYDPELFEESGLSLSFIRTNSPPAMLENGPQHLSVIDWLMFEGFSNCSLRMHECELLPGRQ